MDRATIDRIGYDAVTVVAIVALAYLGANGADMTLVAGGISGIGGYRLKRSKPTSS